MNLSEALKTQTAQIHRETEQVPFLRKFLSGNLSMQEFQNEKSQLYFIYEALELCLEETKQNPFVAKIYFPELFRTVALEKDLVFFFGNSFRDKIKPLPSTKTYVAHLQEISKTSPHKLVSHSYVRYLGDLSGGQILKRVVLKHFPDLESSGTSFYEFPQISNPEEFKKNYREHLDSLSTNDLQKEEILKEAVLAFQLNQEIFKELGT